MQMLWFMGSCTCANTLITNGHGRETEKKQKNTPLFFLSLQLLHELGSCMPLLSGIYLACFVSGQAER